MPGPESPYIPLPGNDRVSARESFNRMASLYDAARSGYPAEVFAELRDRCGLGPRTHVLEIGCGSGQATRDLAELGCTILAVELGAELAALATRNLAVYPNVALEVGVFEDIDLPAGGFDVVFSATAFHWIDPAIGFPEPPSCCARGGSSPS